MAFVRRPLIQRITADLERSAKKVTSQIEVTEKPLNARHWSTEGWQRKGSENVEDSEWGGTVIKWERKANSKHKSWWSHVQSQGKLLGHAQVRCKPAVSGDFPWSPWNREKGEACGSWEMWQTCVWCWVCSCECAWSLGWGSGRIGCGMDFRCRDSRVMLIWSHWNYSFLLSFYTWMETSEQNREDSKKKQFPKTTTKKSSVCLNPPRGCVYTCSNPDTSISNHTHIHTSEHTYTHSTQAKNLLSKSRKKWGQFSKSLPRTLMRFPMAGKPGQGRQIHTVQRNTT